MGIRNNCKYQNLINHIRQVKENSNDLIIEYILINDYEGVEYINESDYFKKTNWLCIIKLDNKEYKAYSTSKKTALLNLMDKTEHIIKDYFKL